MYKIAEVGCNMNPFCWMTGQRRIGRGQIYFGISFFDSYTRNEIIEREAGVQSLNEGEIRLIRGDAQEVLRRLAPLNEVVFVDVFGAQSTQNRAELAQQAAQALEPQGSLTVVETISPISL